MPARKKASRPARSAPRRRAPAARLHPRTVLVPTDFSAEATKALAYGRGMADQFGARLILLHVVVPVGAPDVIYGPLVWRETQVLQAAREGLVQWATEAGLPAPERRDLAVRVGVPWQEITAFAREKKIDLLVVPTHGHTGLTHYLMGSTAEQVVRHAPCPVLVVKLDEHDFISARKPERKVKR